MSTPLAGPAAAAFVLYHAVAIVTTPVQRHLLLLPTLLDCLEEMTSPMEGSSSYKRPPFLLLQDDPPYPLSPKGQGALASLIRTRSASSMLHWRDDEEAAFDRATLASRDDDVEDQRARAEERRMSAILNTPHMRSMRLIGKNNTRYRWESYWKTEDELKAMRKPMYESRVKSHHPLGLLIVVNHVPAANITREPTT